MLLRIKISVVFWLSRDENNITSLYQLAVERIR